MKSIKIFTILTIIVVEGCASLVDYHPIKLPTVEKALISVEKYINNNPIKKGIVLSSANEQLLVLMGGFKDGSIKKIIHYKTIDKITLHEKGSRNSVTIYGQGEFILHRFYFENESMAKGLVNALYTLQHHKYNPYNRYILSITQGENVKKLLSNADAKNVEEQNIALQEEIEKLRKNNQIKTESDIANIQELHSKSALLSDKYNKETIISSSNCIKNVFHKFCLGGSDKSFSNYIEKKVNGDIAQYYFPGLVVVETVKGKIYQVIKMYQNMTWMKYSSLLNRVAKPNGEYIDLSYYPSYVSTDEDRETAINIEKGKALNVWNKKGFTIQLGWVGKETFLRYQHNQLSKIAEELELGEGF